MLTLKTHAEVARELAERLRQRRLRRGWSQAELAERAGLKPATYVLFERTGRISLLRLLKVLEVLDLLDEFDRLGRGEDLAGLTLDEITRPERRRGRRRTANSSPRNLNSSTS
jgi:Predicted transcription factor, homolog of eukaryotic MBF1